MSLPRLRTYTTIVITVVWVVSVGISLAYENRHIDPFVQSIMVINIVWLFGGQYLKTRTNGG